VVGNKGHACQNSLGVFCILVVRISSPLFSYFLIYSFILIFTLLLIIIKLKIRLKLKLKLRLKT
jgi:hypothetical protein